MPVKDLTGLRLGKITVIGLAPPGNRGKSRWFVRCDCGVEKIIRDNTLKHKRSPKSCGCSRIETAKIMGCGNRKAPGIAAFNALYSHYKYSAKVRGIEFDLSKAQFKALTILNCHYCGVGPSSYAMGPKKATKVNGNYLYTGLDRSDSFQGYTTHNCLPCCGQCNYAKLDMPYDEFVAYLNRLVEFRVKNNAAA